VDHFETVRLRRNGSRVDVSLSVSPIRDTAGRIVGAAKICRDITQLKRAREAGLQLTEELEQTAAELEQQVEEGLALQEQLERAYEELSRLLKNADQAKNDARLAQHDAESARRIAEEANATKGRFLATMSHELRTPLNAIAGYVQLLDMGLRGPTTEAQREDLGRIKRSQEALLRLIDDILTFAKVEAGRVEFRYGKVNLGELLATLESFIAPKLREKGLDFSFDACEPDVAVEVDRDKVERAVLNLLSNAVKFTDHGSVRLVCGVESDMIRIEVRDTGRGIAPDKLEEIFQPFVQANVALSQRAEGTGLGLSISRQLARAMGGDVFARSQVGAGSTFTIVLPRTRP
jgi:signal transduction histidine kinase